MKEFIKWASAVIAAVVLAIGGAHTFGATLNPATNLDYLELSQGLKLPAGPSITTANQGTLLQSLANGSLVGGTPCYVKAASQTIAASSTATVDCQASSGATAGTAIPGVQAGDRVFITPGTTTPTTFLGLHVLGASASSTAGFITLKVLNGTGDVFTWTAAASSSFQYLDIR